MFGTAQIVPFYQPPRKEWKDGMEKKKRMVMDLARDEEDGIEEEKFDEYLEDDSSESSEEEESSFDIVDHIADLLPGEVIDGKRPTKQANTTHLEDLRPVYKKKDRLRMFKWLYRFIKRVRAEERERRKHYILKEWEARIKKYDEEQKQTILDKMKAHRNEVLLEMHRAEQRRIRNSRKKVEKNVLIEKFTKDLDRRDKEARVIQYYCDNLSKWAMEGYDRREQEVIEAQRLVDEEHARKKAAAKVARHQQEIEADAKVLEEDKRITKEIEQIMIRYGTVEYDPDLERSHDEQLDDIFQKHRAVKAKAEKQRAQGTLMIGDSESYMKITMKRDLDLVHLKKKLKKSFHRRKATVPAPFVQDLSNTSHILTLKATEIGETGALSLAAELGRGACPMLETLDLNKCEVRSDGIGRIFQGIKTANLLSIRVLKLRGNFIRAAGLQYMLEICPSGVFMNLAVLDLGENELGDEGVSVLVNIILHGYLAPIVDINLQHNSITDQGFFKLVGVMKSLRDAKCPNLERLRLENNLVSPATRRRNAPYPSYISY